MQVLFLVRKFNGLFQIVNGLGNAHHNYHPKLTMSNIVISSYLSIEEEWLLMTAMARGDAENGAIHDVIMMNAGRNIPLADIKITYIDL